MSLSGATEVTVPNLVGKNETDAVALIEGQGLTVGSITVVGSPIVPGGTVIASDPVTNSKLPLGSKVNIILSRRHGSGSRHQKLEVLEARSILTSPSIGYTGFGLKSLTRKPVPALLEPLFFSNQYFQAKHLSCRT